MSEKKDFGCESCRVLNCYKQDKQFPKGCPTAELESSVLNESLDTFKNDPFTKQAMFAAAEVEGKFYGKLTRIEEIAEFAARMQYKVIGIASCVGLSKEASKFADFLKLRGFEVHDFVCKVGSQDKTAVGIPEGHKVNGGGKFEAMCNPVLQAQLLAEKETQLNVIVGLCVGHDSIFIHHSKAPVTYFIVKDRVLGHNPAAAIYTCDFYYKKLFT
jgi:uncharacterized metal-binding protein